MAGADRQGNSVRANPQPSDDRRTRPGLRRVGATFHPGFPAVHRTHAASMADAGAGPQRQEPPRAFGQNACRDFSDVRLRQSKPSLPRFPTLLWSKPVEGEAAGGDGADPSRLGPPRTKPDRCALAPTPMILWRRRSKQTLAIIRNRGYTLLTMAKAVSIIARSFGASPSVAGCFVSATRLGKDFLP